MQFQCSTGHAWHSKIKAPTARHCAEFPPLHKQQWPVGTGCLLCSCLHILLLKNHPLPSQCDKGPIPMMTKLATLTFSSKAVRVGSSCSLEKQGVTSYSMGKKGCRGLQGVEAWGTPQAPEEIQLVHFMPLLQLSSMRLTQKKHQPNLHHTTGAAGGNQVLDIAVNCGHKAPLEHTYDQQL